MRNVDTWTFEQVQEWASRPDHHGQELERIRAVTVSHYQDSGLDDDSRKRWARLSLQANARLCAYNPTQHTRSTTNSFRVRAYVISKLGPDPEEPDWSPEALAVDLLAFLPLPLAQARDLSDRWSALPLDQIRALRDIKNATGVLEDLLPHLPPGPVRDQADQWLGLRPSLP